MDSKKCPDCKQTLPLADFGANRARKDGHAIYCRGCMRHRGLVWFYKGDMQKALAAAHRRDARKQRVIAAGVARVSRQAIREQRALEAEASRNARHMEKEIELAQRRERGKRCFRCGVMKSLDQFFRSQAEYDGHVGDCKSCRGSISKAYAGTHRETRAEKQRTYRQRPEVREARREYKAALRRATGALPRDEYMRLHNARRRVYYDAHVQDFKRHQKYLAIQARLAQADAHLTAWRKHLGHSKLYSREAVRANLYFAIKGHVRKRLKHVIPKFRWKALGYTAEELAEHLEAHFLPGMGWHNRTDWHIDHIKPISSFDIQSIECSSFKECFALSNLRPLWAADNMKKGARIE